MEMNRECVCKMLEQMDQHLRTDLLKKEGKLQEEKLWENTYIELQIRKRNNQESFSLKDHIRAMVYAMISGGVPWDRVAQDMNSETRCMGAVDKIFCEYDTEQLLKCTPEQLGEGLKEIHCFSQFSMQQMKGLLSNIPKLAEIEKEYGSIDAYYRKFIEADDTMHTLIKALSDANSKDKMEQLGIPLACEYLRNVGYDLPKPDTHIRRILGSRYLAFSEKEEVSEIEAIDLVVELAKLAGKSAAETDYILWSYCADGYGEICTQKNPKCEICAANTICKRGL